MCAGSITVADTQCESEGTRFLQESREASDLSEVTTQHCGVDDRSRVNGFQALPPKRKVLFFSPVPHFKGGAERSFLDLISNPEITPCVAAPADGPILSEARSRRLETYVIPFGSIDSVHRPFRLQDGFAALRSLYTAVHALNSICKIGKIEIVHSNGLKAHVINAFARRAGGAFAVIHLRDIPLTKPERLVWRLLKVTADRVVIVSRACWPHETLPNKVVVIHNGIEIPKDAAAKVTSAGNGLTIGFVGRIDHSKGLHLLLSWLKAARTAGLNVRLIIRGRFDSNDTNYERAIFSQVDRDELRSFVSYEGFISDTTKVYEGLDLVCVPSHVPDPLPRSVMEPMAFRIPVIAYPAGGIVEMITDGDTGFLADSEQSFLRAIKSIMEPTERARITGNARRHIEAEFSLPMLYLRLNSLYSVLLENRSRR